MNAAPRPTSRHKRQIAWRVSTLAAAYVGAGGAVSFLGWGLDLPALTDWYGNGISIQPNAAVATAAAGAAVVAANLGYSRVAMVLGGLVTFIGGVTILEYLTGLDPGVDTLLMFDRPWGRTGTLTPGRMGPPGSLSWTLVGIALLLLSSGHEAARRRVSPLAILVTCVSSLSLIGYLFGADVLYTLPRVTTIALQTATFLLATGIALTAAVPEYEPARTLLDDSAPGILARRALPLVILLPVVLGFARLRGEQAGYYDTAMGTALLVLTLIIAVAVVLWHGIRDASGAQERLRQALEFDEAIVTNMGEGLYAVDSQGRVTLMNPAAERLLGWTLDELRGKRMHDATHYKHRDGRPFPAGECAGVQVLRRGEMLTGHEDAFIRKDGTFFDVIYSSSPIRTGSEVTGQVVVFRDVTQEKRLLEAERVARGEAEAANRIKDQFLATLSHELRTPLNAVLGWAAILRSRAVPPDKIATAVEAIERNARIQSRLVEDLLDVSAIVTGKMRLNVQPVIPATVVEAAVTTARPAADAKGIALGVQLAEESREIAADPDRLQQIVWNLLSNAIKFTPHGGRVDVRLQQNNGHIELEVRDTGEGIAPEFLPHVFDRFSQADGSFTRQHGGLGLGMAIVRHLAELHGGDVTASSPGLGQGTSVTVRLPGPE